MAQTKKTANKKRTQKASSKKSNNALAPLFNSNHKTTFSVVMLFISILMCAVVFVDGGSVWGGLRNFMFGLFGMFGYIVPIATSVFCVVALLHKDTRTYKFRVFESFVIFTLVVSLCHVVASEDGLTYGEQISNAYNVFKSYDGTGMHYGFGVFGALFGGVALMLTAGSKVASSIIVILILLALLLIFAGPVIFRLMDKLKKPAEVVGEYEAKLYQFVPGQLAAQYTFSLKTSSIEDVDMNKASMSIMVRGNELYINGVEVDNLTIFNTSGALVANEFGVQQHNIGLLNHGVYIVRVVDIDGNTHVAKFAK